MHLLWFNRQIDELDIQSMLLSVLYRAAIDWQSAYLGTENVYCILRANRTLE